MTLSRKTIVMPLAGLLLVGAAGAVAAASSGTPTGGSTGTVVPAADPSASPTTAPADPATPPDPATKPDHLGFAFRDGSILTDVLDDLVADGTITADQRQAIVDALEAERDARVTAAQEQADQLRTFLEDGVITQEEFDQLPEDSRLRQLAGVMDDGQITTDELRAIGGGLFGGRGHGHGFGPGGFGWDKDRSNDGTNDAEPSPSPTTGS